ncbi:MAG: Flagellar motor switch protein FliN [Phycisphaerales bacterium]|nr:Flagellar motor switch protein FliN [Phycisphaerales bacterium]
MADEKPTDPAYDAQAFADELLKMGSFADATAGSAPAAGAPSAGMSAPDPASDPNAPNLAELEELLKQASFDPAPSGGGGGGSQSAADQALSDRLMEEARAGSGNRGAPLPSTSAFDLPAFEKALNAAQASSIDLLRDVDLNVKIELGRSRMLVEDVLKLVEGSVVELDKLAGDPVDVFVNDRLVARGEVLVLNDNFCVRVNEIIAAIKEEA